MLPAIAAVPQTGYGTVVTGNGGHVIQYTQRSPIEPEVGPHSHEDSQRLRELDLIKGFLVAIGKCRRYHKDNKHLIAFWDSIERHEQRLRQIEEAFKNTLMCEAIRVRPKHTILYGFRHANVTKVSRRKRPSGDPRNHN
jgi:hypothetical protein